MLYQNHGNKFAADDKLFEAGGEVFANLNSAYMGLFGHVTKICRKEGQDTPEICCFFEPHHTSEGAYTREQYVTGKWRRLEEPEESERVSAVMKPEMLEPIPDSLPQSAGTVYALSYFSDSNDGCTSGTLAVSSDVGVLLRNMLDDLGTQSVEVILTHVVGTDTSFSFTYEAKETGVDDLFINYTIALVDCLPAMKGGAAA